MANEKHREDEDAQVPKSDVEPPAPAPANQRHSDQGKLQNTYEAQKTEGIRGGEDRVPRDES
jgi:hypothetical protein